jgi:hypothetical protein
LCSGGGQCGGEEIDMGVLVVAYLLKTSAYPLGEASSNEVGRREARESLAIKRGFQML